jgi:hypothetical protein
VSPRAIAYVALFVSGDRSRTISHKLVANDLCDAAVRADLLLLNGELGAGAAWTLGAVWLEDLAEYVNGVTEAEL